MVGSGAWLSWYCRLWGCWLQGASGQQQSMKVSASCRGGGPARSCHRGGGLAEDVHRLRRSRGLGGPLQGWRRLVTGVAVQSARVWRGYRCGSSLETVPSGGVVGDGWRTVSSEICLTGTRKITQGRHQLLTLHIATPSVTSFLGSCCRSNYVIAKCVGICCQLECSMPEGTRTTMQQEGCHVLASMRSFPPLCPGFASPCRDD